MIVVADMPSRGDVISALRTPTCREQVSKQISYGICGFFAFAGNAYGTGTYCHTIQTEMSFSV